MAELTVDDVACYTSDRLDPDSPETERILKSALRAARNWCGWNVNLVAHDEVTVDSPGGRVLSLPTQNLVELSGLVVDGETVDLSTVRVSTRLGCVARKCGTWPAGYGIAVATMTHGWDDPDDADFNQAVLKAVDSMSVVRADSTLKRLKVDDVEQEWFESAAGALDHNLLAPYRILPSP